MPDEPTPDEPTIESLSAVTLSTRDMARAVGFYRSLGFRLNFGGATDAFTSFHAGASFLNLRLVPASDPTASGLVIFHVRDVDDLYARARAAGLAPEAPPADANWGERYFHLRDPDGNELSFARPL